MSCRHSGSSEILHIVKLPKEGKTCIPFQALTESVISSSFSIFLFFSSFVYFVSIYIPFSTSLYLYTYYIFHILFLPLLVLWIKKYWYPSITFLFCRYLNLVSPFKRKEHIQMSSYPSDLKPSPLHRPSLLLHADPMLTRAPLESQVSHFRISLPAQYMIPPLSRSTKVVSAIFFSVRPFLDPLAV